MTVGSPTLYIISDHQSVSFCRSLGSPTLYTIISDHQSVSLCGSLGSLISYIIGLFPCVDHHGQPVGVGSSCQPAASGRGFHPVRAIFPGVCSARLQPCLLLWLLLLESAQAVLGKQGECSVLYDMASMVNSLRCKTFPVCG